jgi:pyridoxal phosphate enzyme (YggS family)
MQPIPEKLDTIRSQIDQYAEFYGRPKRSIQLLAVSKRQSPSKILEAWSAGQTAFGENYLQEARDKQRVLAKLPIEWHFIGPIQSNKTRDIAEHFSWVHSVDRLKVAKRLSKQRSTKLPSLNICLQVNIDDEATKSGCSPDELPNLALAVNALPQLNLRGLMVIPARRDNLNQQKSAFANIRTLQENLTQNNPSLSLDTLSMGMSNDMEAAIAEGSTMVRIGSSIFGPRE